MKNFWSQVFVRLLLNRLNNPTFQATFGLPVEIASKNRCFDTGYLERCKTNEDASFDLFVTDFMRLPEVWQKNLTSKTYLEWYGYEREMRLKEY